MLGMNILRNFEFDLEEIEERKRDGEREREHCERKAI